MFMPVLWILGLSFRLSPTLSCYHCFVAEEDSNRLCNGYILTPQRIRRPDGCFNKLDSIFNNNNTVIEAGRVGRGYDKELKKIMEAEILPLAKEFHEKENDDHVYEQRLQTAAGNFVAAASKLPRVTGCIPPCGFQSTGAEYNCITCKYDSCQFPLDCPVETINVTEGSSSQIRCNETFPISGDVEVIWRFAEEMKTQQVDRFKEMTVGDDKLYSIRTIHLHHQGTYQCEIYSQGRSIIRLYYYLSVTPRVMTGRTQLQELFDRSLLPGGRLIPEPASAPSFAVTCLLLVCMTASALLFLVSLV